MRGKIARIKEGFGFIDGTDGNDYFFHHSGLEATGKRFTELAIGMNVEFTPIDAPKGPRAIEIRVV